MLLLLLFRCEDYVEFSILKLELERTILNPQLGWSIPD